MNSAYWDMFHTTVILRLTRPPRVGRRYPLVSKVLETPLQLSFIGHAATLSPGRATAMETPQIVDEELVVALLGISPFPRPWILRQGHSIATTMSYQLTYLLQRRFLESYSLGALD